MSQVGPANTTITWTPRGELSEVIEAELKALGCNEIVQAQNRDECVEALVQHSEAPLVLDWEVGTENANVVLRAAKGQYRVETRPICLLILEYTSQAVGVAADYGVLRMHAGPVSRITIKDCLKALFIEDEVTREVRDTLVQVAEARARNEWLVALSLLTDLHQKMPGNERLVLELAENLIHDERWGELDTILKALVTQDPPNIRALHLLGRARMRSGDFQGAIELLQRAKIINPLNVDRLIDLGNCLLSEGQIDQAMVEFQAARVQDPANKDAAVGESKCLLMSGDVNEALTLLKAISGPREMASIFNTAAVLSMRREEFTKGMSLYRSALTALGQNQQLAAKLHYNIGLGFRRWQKLDQASQHFALSLELDPSFDKAKEQLEKVLAILGVDPKSDKKSQTKDKAPRPHGKTSLPVAPAATKSKVSGDSVVQPPTMETLAPIDWEPEE